MGNDVSVGAVTNINVADISPHLSALIGGDSNTRPHGRVFTNLRCRYSRSIDNQQQRHSSSSSSGGAYNPGVLEFIGASDADVRWEDGTALSIKVFLRSYEDAQEAREVKRAVERAILADKTIRTKLHQIASSSSSAASSSSSVPCCRPISILHQEMFRVTERAIWMARPWVHHSVLQRVHMRPNCSLPRRLFFVYQVLRALSQLHDQCGISHGDVKVENVLVDSHGWVYLTDISSFYKPTFLPAFDPEVFEKCFNTGVRSSCCIAPERFVDKDNVPNDPFHKAPTKSADVFSAASTIVSILTDVPCFMSLSDVLNLRRMLLQKDNNGAGEDGGNPKCNKVDEKSLNKQKPVSPSTATGASHPTATEDNQSHHAKSSSGEVGAAEDDKNNKNNSKNKTDESSAEAFYRSKIVHAVAGTSAASASPALADMIVEMALGSAPGALCPSAVKSGNVERPTAMQIVSKYTPSIFPASFSLLYDDILPTLLTLTPDLRCNLLFKNLRAVVDRIIELDAIAPNSSASGNKKKSALIDTAFFSTQQEITVNLEAAMHVKRLSKHIRADAPTLCTAFECLSSVFVQCVRRSVLEQSLLVSLSLIARAAPLFPDATLRDPLLPLIVSILQATTDTTDTVRVFALDALVFVCAALSTEDLSASNAFTFEDYVLPALCECGSAFARSPAVMVTLARALPISFLLCSEVAERREAMGPAFRSGFGYFGLKTITVERVWDTMKRLLNSSHTAVVLSALRALPPLLPHLGSDIVVGQVLPMLTLWFNSNYVELRREMFRIMFEVVSHCSPQQQVLATVGLDLALGKEEDVLCIASVLEGLRSALLKRCFPRSRALEYVKKTAFLVTHSSREVARAAAAVIEAAAATLDPVELSVFVLAPIAPFLRSPMPVSELVRRNYDVIKPGCRVPDPPAVVVIEGTEYLSWVRDLGLIDIHGASASTAAAAAAASLPVIQGYEAERVAALFRDAGIDVDPFFCVRGVNSNNNNNSNNKNASRWIMFNERRGKLLPRLLSRQSQRLKEMALADTAGENAASPWWANKSAPSFAGGAPAAAASSADLGSPSTHGFLTPGLHTSRSSSNNYINAASTTATSAAAATATAAARKRTVFMGSSGSTLQQPQLPQASPAAMAMMAGYSYSGRVPKPTGVPVASHSEAHRGGVRCMTAQMQYLATGGGDGSVRVWDTEDAILGAGYLDERARSIFDGTNSSFGSDNISSNGGGEQQQQQQPQQQVAAAITSLHFLGSTPGQTLIVGNDLGHASIYHVVAQAADPVRWASHNAETRNGSGGIVSISTPGMSEAALFLGMAGGVIGAIDLRCNSIAAVWTARTPAPAGPLVQFMFPSTDGKLWSAVSVNRTGLVALWDLRMRAIVASMDVAVDQQLGRGSSVSSPSYAAAANKGRRSGGGSLSPAAGRAVGNVTSACICEGFLGASNNGGIAIPSVAVATDTIGIHRVDLATMTPTLLMRPTTTGSVRAMASLGGMLFSAGTDSLLRSWNLEYPERSYTVSRGLEPSPPYSLAGAGTIVAEALPAAVDLVTMGGGWVDIGDGAAPADDALAAAGMGAAAGSNGSPLHSDAIECVSIISVTPSTGANFGGNNSNNKSFSSRQAAMAAQGAAGAAAGGGGIGGLEPDQLHVCTGSRDGSVALWRNSTDN